MPVCRTGRHGVVLDAPASGVESRFIYFPDEGHHILKPANSRLFYREMLDW